MSQIWVGGQLMITSLIKLFIYLLGLSLVVLFEFPRINLLLSLVFPGDFPAFFAWALPVLVLGVSILIKINNLKFKNLLLGAIYLSFTGILILSYFNTVLISVQDSKDFINDEISRKEKEKNEKFKELKSLSSGNIYNNCSKPSKESEEYRKDLESYNLCLSAINGKVKNKSETINILKEEIKDISISIVSLKSSEPDYFKAISQSLTGLFLSIILGIVTAVFSSGFSSELIITLNFLNFTEEKKIALFLSEGLTVREIAKKLDISSTTAHKRIVKFIGIRNPNKAGTKGEQNGTRGEQAKTLQLLGV